MTHTIAAKTLQFFFASLLMFSLTNCTKEAAEQDENSNNQLGKAAGKNLNLKKEYKAMLSPLNNSGVTGMATLMLDGNMLTVTIEAMGLEAGKPHPQHIHGFADTKKNSTCPTMAADTNGDGLVDLMEGLPSYGPVLLNLTPVPVADATGKITYTQTFEISSELLPLQNRAIVLHGMTVDGTYWPTLPVACGQIQNWNSMYN